MGAGALGDEVGDVGGVADGDVSRSLESGGSGSGSGDASLSWEEKVPLSMSKVKVVLLDIEGTVCPISFVKDELFPYFLRELPHELEHFWNSPALKPFIDAFPLEHRNNEADLHSYCVDLVTRDIKDPALKSLQGHIWQKGYFIGKLKCELFHDVAYSIIKWKEAGVKIVIYSSGSIQAQKLLFGHTLSIRMDLNPEISAYHDITTAGLKNDPTSYEKIYQSFCAEDETLQSIKRDEWLFLSDNVHEIDAAISAGMSAAVVVREGNPPLSPKDMEQHEVIRHFGELEIPGKGILSPVLTQKHLELLDRSIEMHKLPFSSGHHTRTEMAHAEKIVDMARNLRQLLEKDVRPGFRTVQPLESDRDPAIVGNVRSGLLTKERKRKSTDYGLSGGEMGASREALPNKKLKHP